MGRCRFKPLHIGMALLLRQSRWHGISANGFAILVRAYCCKALRMPAVILRAYRTPSWPARFGAIERVLSCLTTRYRARLARLCLSGDHRVCFPDSAALIARSFQAFIGNFRPELLQLCGCRFVGVPFSIIRSPWHLGGSLNWLASRYPGKTSLPNLGSWDREAAAGPNMHEIRKIPKRVR